MTRKLSFRFFIKIQVMKDVSKELILNYLGFSIQNFKFRERWGFIINNIDINLPSFRTLVPVDIQTNMESIHLRKQPQFRGCQLAFIKNNSLTRGLQAGTKWSQTRLNSRSRFYSNFFLCLE